MMLESIVIIGLVAPFVVGLSWRWPRLRAVLAGVAALYHLIALSVLYGRTIATTYARIPFLGTELSLRLTPLSWLFGIGIATIGLLGLIYSFSYMKGKHQLGLYYLLYLLVNAGMIGVVLSGDLITFYIMWEIMSVATFLSIGLARGQALPAGMKYILFSIGGSTAMLLAIVSLYITYGTVNIAALSAAMSGASVGYALSILVLFSVAFGIKNAVWPFHAWLPDAYAESVTPFSAVLSGMLTRMGVYGFLLVMYGMIGLPLVQRMTYGPVGYQIVLAWIAGITIVFGVFTAVLHDDAKRLLSWSSIGHGGYMILGLVLAGTLNLSGGIFHVINYAMSVSLLFFVVGAVEYRTGTRDLTQLGGLKERMPVTFIAALIGVLGMIGVPLTSGFVSKWLIYKGLILGGHPFLAFAALIGTWGTILYGYKLIHNVFLGRMPARFEEVEEVPWGMRIPMIALAGLIVLFGILPGIPLRIISLIETSFGISALPTAIVGAPSGVGELNLLNILGGILAVAIAMYAIFSPTARARRAARTDTYTAGAPTPAVDYHYTSRFYDPAERIIRPYLTDWCGVFYSWVGRQANAFFNGARKVYSGNINTYALWIVILLGVFVTMNLLGWRP